MNYLNRIDLRPRIVRRTLVRSILALAVIAAGAGIYLKPPLERFEASWSAVGCVTDNGFIPGTSERVALLFERNTFDRHSLTVDLPEVGERVLSSRGLPFLQNPGDRVRITISAESYGDDFLGGREMAQRQADEAVFKSKFSREIPLESPKGIYAREVRIARVGVCD